MQNHSKDLHYKDDSTFLRFLTMSYVGEVAAIELMAHYGHEFEFDGYGAGSREMFKDEILKKKRTPDLICKLCKQKLEVRSKSHLAVRMSDSASRPFDRELMAADWVGFVRVVRRNNSAAKDFDPLDPDSYSVASSIYVTTVAELTRTKAIAVRSKPKSESQGSETYLDWPTLAAPCNGTIVGVEYGAPSKIHIKNDRGYDVCIQPPVNSFPYNGLRMGDTIKKYETLICGVARMLTATKLNCSGVSKSAVQPPIASML